MQERIRHEHQTPMFPNGFGAAHAIRVQAQMSFAVLIKGWTLAKIDLSMRDLLSSMTPSHATSSKQGGSPMLTHIVHPSAHLCAFLDQLNLPLSQPQQRHLRNLVDALLVCESRKTLAALRREFVAAPDVSNMADCLRISPWRVDDLRQMLGAFLVHWAIQQAEATAAPHVIY